MQHSVACVWVAFIQQLTPSARTLCACISPKLHHIRTKNDAARQGNPPPPPDGGRPTGACLQCSRVPMKKAQMSREAAWFVVARQGDLFCKKNTNPSNCTTEQYISAEKLLCDNGPQLTPAKYPCNSCRGLQGCWPSLGPGCASAGWAWASACCLRTAGWPGRMFGRNVPT